MAEVSLEVKQYLDDLLQSFSPGLRYVCAYGSGVFKQDSHKSINENMIDLIFVVHDSFTWHQQNLKRYPNHYSFLKHLQPHQIANIQKHYGTAIYYNTRIEFGGRQIKYGVIELNDFLNDLKDWTFLYVAGRLHKPVYHLKGIDNPTISTAFKYNLENAVKTSLLLCSEKTSCEDFFMKIASLSYTGDLRMVVGEDRNKVRNIVKPNMDKFRKLYYPIVSNCISVNITHDTIEQDLSETVQLSYLSALPLHLKRTVYKGYGLRNDMVDYESNLKLIRNRKQLQKVLHSSVSKLVRGSSTSQSLKGIMTGGFKKSIAYSAEKLVKMMSGLKK